MTSSTQWDEDSSRRRSSTAHGTETVAQLDQLRADLAATQAYVQQLEAENDTLRATLAQVLPPHGDQGVLVKREGRLPYGYVRSAGQFIQIDQEAVEVIQHIFALHAQGHTNAEIARQLTQAGIQTPRGALSWSHQAVGIILRHRDVYEGQGDLPQIVSVPTGEPEPGNGERGVE